MSACGRLLEHKHCMKWFSREYSAILATTSGLANDSKHTFVRALFTQPSDLFWSWEKISSQTGKPWGKGYWTCLFWSIIEAHSWLGVFYKLKHTHSSWLSKWGLICVLWSCRAGQVTVLNMFWVPELGFTSLPDICCLSLTINCAQITSCVPLSEKGDSSALTALPAIVFSGIY